MFRSGVIRPRTEITLGELNMNAWLLFSWHYIALCPTLSKYRFTYGKAIISKRGIFHYIMGPTLNIASPGSLYWRNGWELFCSRIYRGITGARKSCGMPGRGRNEKVAQDPTSLCNIWKNEVTKAQQRPEAVSCSWQGWNQMIRLPASLSVWSLWHKMEIIMPMIHPPQTGRHEY